VFVAVVPNGTYAVGVDGPDDDWRIEPGQPGNNRFHKGKLGVRSDYVVTHLDNALHAHYDADAYLVAYTLRDSKGQSVARQPRINKNGLPFVESLGYKAEVSVLFADIDNPKLRDSFGKEHKQRWNPDLMAAMMALETKLGQRGLNAGIYYSRNGCRIAQPLSKAIPISEFDRMITWYLDTLDALGFGRLFTIDDKCTDWGRHFALPFVRKDDGTDLRLRMSLGYMKEIEPLESLEGKKLHKKKNTKFTEGGQTYTNVGNVDDAPLAKAFDAAGWLGERVSATKRAAICPWNNEHSANSDWTSTSIIWAASVENPLGNFYCSRHHGGKHFSQTEVYWALPPHARALLPHRPHEGPKKTPEPPPPPPEPVSKSEARAKMEQAFRRAPGGLSVLAVTCGTGKTQSAIQIAVERALRGRLYGKTAISVPTNELAIEITERIRGLGAAVKRIFGPPSLKDPVTKEPICKLHASASILAGGISVPFEYCQGRGKLKCDYYEGCAARDGQDGPDDARIVVGPHKMLSMLSAETGEKGLLVIDEPGSLIQDTVIEEIDLQDVFDNLSYFEGRFANAMRVSVQALQTWVKTERLDAEFSLVDATRLVDDKLMVLASNATGGGQNAVECAELAYEPIPAGQRRRPQTPPVQRSWIDISKNRPKLAATLAKTSRITSLLHLGLTKPGEVAGRIEIRGRQKVLVLASWDVQLREALTTPDNLGLGPRIGAVVIADAGGRHLIPALQNLQRTLFSTKDDRGRTVVSYEEPIPLTEVFVGDGAPIERTILRMKASKTSLFPDDELKLTPAFLRMLRSAINWAVDRGAQKTALITFKKLREAFDEILSNTVKPPKSDKEALLRWEIGRELCRLPQRPDLGHYGAIRGLDHWKDHDCLITLGDPRPNLSDGKWDARFLGIEDWETRYAQLTASELEQAHGRLRTVHRTTPAFALHVGLMTPSGGHVWGELEDRGGQARKCWMTKADVESAVALAGSIRAAAKALNLDEKTLRRILNNNA